MSAFRSYGRQSHGHGLTDKQMRLSVTTPWMRKPMAELTMSSNAVKRLNICVSAYKCWVFQLFKCMRFMSYTGVCLASFDSILIVYAWDCVSRSDLSAKKSTSANTMLPLDAQSKHLQQQSINEFITTYLLTDLSTGVDFLATWYFPYSKIYHGLTTVPWSNYGVGILRWFMYDGMLLGPVPPGCLK